MAESEENLVNNIKQRAMLYGADVQIHSLSSDPKLNQDITETPHIKEEPEEQSIKQEEDQLQEFSTVSVKSEELQQRQTEHREETQGEDCGGAVQNLRSFKTETLPEICDIVIKDVFSLSDISYKTEDPEKNSSSCPVLNDRFNKQSILKTHRIIHTEAVNKSPFFQQRKTQNKREQKQDDVLSETEEHSSSDSDSSWDWDPPARSSTQQTEADGDDYNHVQMKDTNTTVQNPNTKSSPETNDTVEYGDISGSEVEVKTHECSVCKKRYKTKQILRRHTKVHIGEKPYSCSICEKTFIPKNKLTLHMRTHAGERPYCCSVCQKTFNQNSYLKKHMKTHSGEKPYSCSFCNKAFNRRNHLKKHIGLHTGERPYSCSICDKTFSQNGHLKTHMRTHTGEKPFSCSICIKTFNQSSHLKKHMTIHTGVKPYSCSICKKPFFTNGDLKIHTRTHTGEKPYSCSICKKTFNQKSNLRTHMKSHTGVKPHRCSICKKTFGQNCHLKAHMKTHTQKRNLTAVQSVRKHMSKKVT